jgi:hypothetical protein
MKQEKAKFLNNETLETRSKGVAVFIENLHKAIVTFERLWCCHSNTEKLQQILREKLN